MAWTVGTVWRDGSVWKGREGGDDCFSRAYVTFLTVPAVLTFPAFLAFVRLEDLVDEE